MLRYRGTYRIVFEQDKRTGKPLEFTFIPCCIRGGSNICRHYESALSAYIPGIKTANRLLKEQPDIFRPFQIRDSEATLLFNESDMERAAIILIPRVMGKNMNPRPKKEGYDFRGTEKDSFGQDEDTT